jgi:hypothetical protein
MSFTVAGACSSEVRAVTLTAVERASNRPVAGSTERDGGFFLNVFSASGSRRRAAERPPGERTRRRKKLV